MDLPSEKNVKKVIKKVIKIKKIKKQKDESKNESINNDKLDKSNNEAIENVNQLNQLNEMKQETISFIPLPEDDIVPEEELKELTSAVLQMSNLMESVSLHLQRLHEKIVKLQERNKILTPNTSFTSSQPLNIDIVPTEFEIPRSLKKKARKFFNTEELSKADMVKRIHAYILQNKLQSVEDDTGRTIECDESLKNLLKVEKFHFFELTTYINNLFKE